MMAAGRPASSPSIAPERAAIGCGQEMPRAARWRISSRKNGRSAGFTRFS